MTKELKINLLTDFLFFLNQKDLINNHDFDYEKQAKKFIKNDKRKRKKSN